MSRFSPQLGGFWRLKAHQAAEVICGFTAEFCRRYGGGSAAQDKVRDRMIQVSKAATASIVKAMRASAVANKSEMGLMSDARSHLEELLNMYQEFMHKHRLPFWSKDDPLMKEIRSLAYRTDRTWQTYSSYLTTEEKAANCALGLTHQVNYLLDQQMRAFQRRAEGQWSSYRRTY